MKLFKGDKWLGWVWLILGCVTLYLLVKGYMDFAVYTAVGALVAIAIYDGIKYFRKRSESKRGCL